MCSMSLATNDFARARFGPLIRARRGPEELAVWSLAGAEEEVLEELIW